MADPASKVTVLAVAALAAAAVLIAGCSSDDGRVDGPVTIYVSLPLTGPRAAEGNDAADGARLALEQAGGRAGELEVRAEFLDDAVEGSAWDPVAVGRNARAAASDSTTVVYIGELDSQPTRASAPITNDAGIAQVSPGAGGVDLTRPAEGYPDSPDAYRPSGGPTFARVIPDDAALVAAAAQLASRTGARGVSVSSDGTPYQDLIASAFTEDAAEAGVRVVESGEDAALVATEEGPLRLDGEGGSFELSATLDPGLLSGKSFASEFEAEFGRPPGPYAAYGYEAMDLALAGIAEADRGEGFRRSVADSILDADRPDSILGAYSITPDGDTTLCAIQPYESGGGGGLTPREPICASS